MPTLPQLQAAHDRLLVLDAASTRVQTGWRESGQAWCWESSADEAGRGLFACVDRLLAGVKKSLTDVDAFIFCEGPGSMLGTRTVAMALRTWQVLGSRPIYSYQSLALAGRGVWRQRPMALQVIADARRESWHVQTIGADGHLAPLQRRGAGALPDGETFTPEHFRQWSRLPSGVTACSYDLPTLFAAVTDADLFQACLAPDAFQHEAPEYVKWSAQIHSADTAPRK